MGASSPNSFRCSSSASFGYASPSPARIAWNAIRIVCREEAQNRLTVVPGTLAGRPARSAERRARFMPCFCSGNPHPSITSTMSPRSSSETCFRAASMAKAARSSGRASTSDPFPARPIGVRAAEMMTASDKGVFSCQLATDDQFLDLARSLVEGRNARVSEVLPDRELVNVAIAAVHLDGRVRGSDGGLACVVLRDRRLERVPGPGVGRQSGPPGEQAGSVGLDGDLGQQLLHELERGDGTAELAPFRRVGEAGFEAGLADADTACRE